MRKIIFCLIVFVIIFSNYLPKQTLLFEGIEGEYTFYIGEKNSNAGHITLPSSEAKSMKKNLKNISGESVSFATDNKIIDDLIAQLDAQLISTETVGNLQCFYYYSSKIEDFVKIGSDKINLHIAVNSDLTTIGSPFIFGSF